MNKKSYHITRKTVPFFFFFLIVILISYFNNTIPNSFSANETNVTPEKNSTFFITDLDKQGNDVGITYIISSETNPKGNVTNLNDNFNSGNVLLNQSKSNESNNSVIKFNGDSNLTSSTNKLDSNNVTSKSSQGNSFQRGEYKIDANGIHYYNINNCSEAKGTSGIGNLSECEDAEREMKKEM